jgi:hypothetical protein
MRWSFSKAMAVKTWLWTQFVCVCVCARAFVCVCVCVCIKQLKIKCSHMLYQRVQWTEPSIQNPSTVILHHVTISLMIWYQEEYSPIYMDSVHKHIAYLLGSTELQNFQPAGSLGRCICWLLSRKNCMNNCNSNTMQLNAMYISLKPQFSGLKQVTRFKIDIVVCI